MPIRKQAVGDWKSVNPEGKPHLSGWLAARMLMRCGCAVEQRATTPCSTAIRFGQPTTNNVSRISCLRIWLRESSWKADALTLNSRQLACLQGGASIPCIYEFRTARPQGLNVHRFNPFNSRQNLDDTLCRFPCEYTIKSPLVQPGALAAPPHFIAVPCDAQPFFCKQG